MAVLSCSNLKKTFEGYDKPILNGISLELKEGCFACIMGRSGSGKSTLLKALCGLTRVDEGEIDVAGYDVKRMSIKKRSVFRSSVIGIVFQEKNLLPDFNVEDNILTPMFISGKKVDKEYYKKLVKITGMEGHTHKMPSQLSGGMQQRVAIARALIAKPKVIFADEPTGSLDSNTEIEIIKLFRSVNQEFGTTIVMVTHSQTCADASDRVIYFNDGTIIEK